MHVFYCCTIILETKWWSNVDQSIFVIIYLKAAGLNCLRNTSQRYNLDEYNDQELVIGAANPIHVWEKPAAQPQVSKEIYPQKVPRSDRYSWPRYEDLKGF